MPSECAVVITGSAGGIGSALVNAFRRHGYHVIGVDREWTQNASHSLKFDLEEMVVNEANVNTFQNELESALEGRQLVALVNNAAVQILGAVDTLTVAEFRKTIDVNLVAAFAMIKACLPKLRCARGTVINIGSIHARLTKHEFSAYAASKGGLESLTRALAVELGGLIQVAAISPAAVDTPMLRAGFANAPEALSELAECHPSARLAQPEEIGELAVFLASGRISFVNGAVIDMQGGIGGRLHDPV